ncbi:hypothetical protein [Modestobacter sp. SYSU DS0875]
MTRPPLWRLAPWTRAPLLGLRSPAAVVAVLVTTAILACAVASAPLFLSSARSAALQQQLAPQCAEAGWVQAGVTTRQFDQNGVPRGGTASAAVDDALAAAWAAQGRTSRPVLATSEMVGQNRGPGAASVTDAAGRDVAIPVSLFHRPDALQHVEVVGEQPGAGLWLPVGYADGAGITLGDRIAVAGTPVTVTGLYTDLFAVDPGPYWCDYRLLYANDTSSDVPPPAFALATDPATFHEVAAGFTGVQQLAQVPVEAGELSISDARALLAAQDRAQDDTWELLGVPAAELDVSWVNPRLVEAVQRAELIESGLRGPVVPVAVAGALLALVLVAAAGSFWADRRVTEVRLLAARGVGPVPLAGKAALELGLPALAGAALGWAASRLLIGGVGPADDLDSSATTAALAAGAAAFVVGLGAAAAVAGLRARGAAERPLGAAPRWPATVPWELALLVAAAWCWLLLESRDAVVTDAGVAQVNGLLVAFPLLAVAGAAALLARLVTALLPRLRRWAGRRSPAVFLAVNRLTAARLATATLLAAVTLPVAVLGYTATLTASSQATLDAKVGVQVGAERALTSVSRLDAVPGVEQIGTFVVRYDGDVVGAEGVRTDVQVLAVDPGTFAGTAFWDDSFADDPLPELMAALQGPAVDGRVPVVAQGVPLGDPQLRLGTAPLAAEVVAQARVLPGRRTVDPVVLVAADRVPTIERSAGSARQSEIWTNGRLAPAVDALVDAGGLPGREITPAAVLNTANFLGITWTFGYLSALAVFVGVIAVGGLLLYLEARSRTRVAGYVMARRLGLTRRAHLRSLLAELIGVAAAGVLLGGLLAAGAVALVHRRLDVDLLRPPTPLLDVRWPALGLSAGVVVVVAGLAALYAQRAADRADPATVLRQEA